MQLPRLWLSRRRAASSRAPVYTRVPSVSRVLAFSCLLSLPFSIGMLMLSFVCTLSRPSVRALLPTAGGVAKRTAHLFLSPLHVLARPPTAGPLPAARLAISLFPPYSLFLSITLHLSFFLSHSLSPARSAISLRRAALPNASRGMPCMSLRPPSLEPHRPLVWWTRSLQLLYCASNSLLLPRADLELLIYLCTHARASGTITMAHSFHGVYSSSTQPCDALASLAKWNCSTLSRVASLWHRELHDRIDFETISPLAEGLIPGSKRSESIAPRQAVSAQSGLILAALPLASPLPCPMLSRSGGRQTSMQYC